MPGRSPNSLKVRRRRRPGWSDATGQSLAHIYAGETKAQADAAKVLTVDEARRIAANIAKLPTLLRRK